MPVLAKAGCNQGTCHGNRSGKGGFKLSLRGQDPDVDFQTLTRELTGRRINGMAPPESLLLLKPTTQLAHEGGLRFRVDSEEYAALCAWITEGCRNDLATAPALDRIEVTPTERLVFAPADSVQLQVHAIFADGSKRDITRLAVYEPATTLVNVSHDGLVRQERPGETTVLVRFLSAQVPVRLAFVPERPGFQWTKVPENNFIDSQIFAKLRDLRIQPSALCDDTTYLRRAYLDLLGLLPTAPEARAFASDRNPDKRARLIESLLDRPEYADFWTLKWSDLLRVEEKVLDRKGIQNFQHWIRQSVAENKPLDEFVREILSARGSTYAHPAANYLRALRDPVKRAESTAQLFLGVRLQCAQCHNHPFDRWTQDDYYSWAGVFARVNYKVLENHRSDGLDTHEFNGEQIVVLPREGEVTNARNGRPAPPRFLAVRETENSIDRLDALASWLTSPTNTWFAKAQVNRVWYQFFGRGLVDPIDDFRPTNPPSHPELLEILAQEFVAHHFDVRHLIRLITRSRAYQLSYETTPSNADDVANYSHMIPRRLSAEQLLDAQYEVLGVQTHFDGWPAGLRAAQLPGGTPVQRGKLKPSSPEMFLSIFGKPARLLTCECERSGETTMGQAFQLISGPAINSLLTRPENRLGQWLASSLPDAEMIDQLYWTVVSRPPTVEERHQSVAMLTNGSDRRQALEDVTWSLLNAKEFVLRR